MAAPTAVAGRNRGQARADALAQLRAKARLPLIAAGSSFDDRELDLGRAVHPVRARAAG